MKILDKPRSSPVQPPQTGESRVDHQSPHVMLDEVVDIAAGRTHSDDPVTPGTGGPAGNAQLTAWLGLTLLVLFLAQLVTLLDVRGHISWHLTLGLLLVPPSLAKTATTTWRMVRYYTGVRVYQQAGPPPLLLRMLGPLVILSTLALLGTGVMVLAVGPTVDTRPLLTALGQPISPLTLHQAAFFVWAIATGLHVLARFIPAVHLAATSTRSGLRLPGLGRRIAVVVATGALAVLVAIAGLSLSTAWTPGS